MDKSKVFVGLTLALLVADLLIKKWAVMADPSFYLGPFGIDLVRDMPAISNDAARFAASMRTIAMATFAGFLLCLLAVALFVYPATMQLFKLAFAIVSAGMVGGILDNILYGSFIRYVTIKSGYTVFFSMSLSDLLTIGGFILYIQAFVKYKDELIPKTGLRKLLWINPEFQRRYSFWIVGMGICYTIVIGIFFASFLNAVVGLNSDMDPLLRAKSYGVFAFSFLFMSLIHLLILFLFSRHITHNVAGPIFAFNRYVRKLLDKKADPNESLKLRDNDEFKELEELASLLKEKLK